MDRWEGEAQSDQRLGHQRAVWVGGRGTGDDGHTGATHRTARQDTQAALLVVGDEILSGATADVNIQACTSLLGLVWAG